MPSHKSGRRKKLRTNRFFFPHTVSMTYIIHCSVLPRSPDPGLHEDLASFCESFLEPSENVNFKNIWYTGKRILKVIAGVSNCLTELRDRKKFGPRPHSWGSTSMSCHKTKKIFLGLPKNNFQLLEVLMKFLWRFSNKL